MRLDRAVRFYDAPIGKKAIIALTGVIMFGYVIGHLAGNLQIFLPPDENGQFQIDHYAAFLHHTPALLWGTRLVLLAAVIMHITATLQLQGMKNGARPIAYQKKENPYSTIASRTMIFSGLMIAAFIVYHLLHFTVGVEAVSPGFQDLKPHHNVVTSFSNPAIAGVYIFAMILLGFHLYHGLWSMFQSLGLSHPRYTPLIKTAAKAFTIILIAGEISIPIAVLTKVIQ